jgi:hypothetical protein
MKAIYAFVLAFLLAAPTFAAPLSGSAETGGFHAFATLADANNPVEMAVAPEYTRLAVVRSSVARWLNKMTTTSDADADKLRAAIFSANAIQRYADAARAKLDGLAQSKKDDSAFRVGLDEVRGLIKRAETMHDNAVKGN